MPKYIVKTASTPMPSSVRSPYGKVAVLELEDGFEGEPKMISEHARGVKRIVTLDDKLYMGKTEQCAFQKAVREAQEYADELNNREQHNA